MLPQLLWPNFQFLINIQTFFRTQIHLSLLGLCRHLLTNSESILSEPEPPSSFTPKASLQFSAHRRRRQQLRTDQKFFPIHPAFGCLRWKIAKILIAKKLCFINRIFMGSSLYFANIFLWTNFSLTRN